MHQMQKWFDLDEILYLRVSKIADLEIRNSKWRMQCGWPKYDKQLDLSEFQGFINCPVVVLYTYSSFKI